jgi:hypothetical protein
LNTFARVIIPVKNRMDKALSVLKRDIGIIAIKVMGQNALIGNVSGDDLLRYALSLSISVANVGVDGFTPLASCVKVGKESLISEKEARQIELNLNFDSKVTRLLYYRV